MSIIAQVKGSGTPLVCVTDGPAMSNSNAFVVELAVNDVNGLVSEIWNHWLSKVSNWLPAPFVSPIETRSLPVIVSEPTFNTRKLLLRLLPSIEPQ